MQGLLKGRGIGASLVHRAERGAVSTGVWAPLRQQVCNATDTCSARCSAGVVCRRCVQDFIALARKKWESFTSHYLQAAGKAQKCLDQL